MLSTKVVIGIFIILGLYTFLILFMPMCFRKCFKMTMYVVTFISLLLPEVNFVVLPFGYVVSFRVCAAVLSGMELIEMLIKEVLDNRLRKTRKLSPRLKRIYKEL